MTAASPCPHQGRNEALNPPANISPPLWLQFARIIRSNLLSPLQLCLMNKKGKIHLILASAVRGLGAQRGTGRVIYMEISRVFLIASGSYNFSEDNYLSNVDQTTAGAKRRQRLMFPLLSLEQTHVHSHRLT